MLKRQLFICFLAALVYLSLIAAPLSAQSQDQTPVIDSAGIFDNRFGEVETAVGNLVSQGADVRVRTIATYGNAGNLDLYEQQLEQASPSWKGPDGNLKNNLIVMIIALQERQTGLYYGTIWAGTLDSNWIRIQTEIMNPRFKAGDYVNGVVQGLGEIRNLLQSKVQSPTSTRTNLPQTPITQIAKGSSSGWIIPVVIIVILGLATGLLVFMSMRKNKAKRQAARQKALLVKQGAASGINELIEKLQMLEIKVDVTAAKVAPEEIKGLKEPLEKSRKLIDQSSQSYSELSHSAGDPENPELSESALAAIEGKYQKILDDLREAREKVKQTEDKITSIQDAIDSFPLKVDAVNKAIEDSQHAQSDLEKAGFKTAYPAGLVAKGRATLEQAKALIGEKRYLEALNTVNLAGDQISESVKAGGELPRKKAETESAVPALAARLEQVKTTIDTGRNIFDKIATGYAETNWASVRGNGSEAENRIDWAQDALEDARTAAGTERQDYHQAMELIDKGNKWLAEAESLMKSISELDANLAIARRDAPNEIEAAQTDVKTAWDYINRFDDDIRESLEDDLRQAEGKNNLAREELKKNRPDYFNVIKLARETNESADKILAQARNEHEAAERLRVRAASTLRDANTKVSIANKYLEDHQAVVRSEARNYLNSAIESLRQAGATGDVNSQIVQASQAEVSADQAYSSAQRDVNTATVNFPGPGIPRVIVIPPIGHPGGDLGWGSRRSNIPSSGGGVIRRSGGGSTGWGSGGGGSRTGGGSTGW
jgi:uncharacterized membrane protein YgcG